MYKTYFSYIISLIILLSSCKKYLAEKPDASLAVPSTVQDYQALLDRTNLLNTKNASWDETSSDDYYLPITTYSSLNGKNRDAYIWEYNNYSDYPNDWSFGYDAVYVANLAIEGIKKVPINQQNLHNGIIFMALRCFSVLIISSKPHLYSPNPTILALLQKIGVSLYEYPQISILFLPGRITRILMTK